MKSVCTSLTLHINMPPLALILNTEVDFQQQMVTGPAATWQFGLVARGRGTATRSPGFFHFYQHNPQAAAVHRALSLHCAVNMSK